MSASFWLRALAVWALLAALAIGAGALREELYAPLLGRRLAEGLATVKLIGLWLLLAYGFLAWRPRPAGRSTLHGVGALWLALAVGLEWLLQSLAAREAPGAWRVVHGWWRGDLWVVLLAALYAAPLLMGRLVRPDRPGTAGRELSEG